MSDVASDGTLSTLKELFAKAEDFSLAEFLPNVGGIMANIAVICRIVILVGPILLLLLGLAYYFRAPKEANWYFGYRTYFGMGSPRAWQYTQHLAGMVFAGLGAVLTIVMIAMCIWFAFLDIQSIVWYTVYCLIAEVVLAGGGVIFINCWTMNCFDAKGRVRKKKA